MKFDQLIEYNMRNGFFFLKTCAQNAEEKLGPRPFSEKLKSSISLDQQSKGLQFVFYVCQAKGYRDILKLSCRPLVFTLF